MTLKELATQYHAFEKIDKSEFQRKARVLQSMWREEQKLPVGVHASKSGPRPLGSRLLMPAAENELSSFLSDNIKRVVRREVCDPHQRGGRLFGRPRIFNDLLSSQPLCFNLFAELHLDLNLATKVFHELTRGRIHRVIGIQFEYSPGRRDARYTADNSAFDVFVTFDTPSGQSGFAGIEVKYHENLVGQAAEHRDRYDEIATKCMTCFKPEMLASLQKSPLQQIWRDHLLAGILKHEGKFADGFFAILAPAQNLDCRSAIERYGACLSEPDAFIGLSIEVVWAAIKKHTDAAWVDEFRNRYLNFSKIDRLIGI